MKKISKLLAIAAGVSALFFTGCSDVDTGTYAKGTNDKSSNATDYSVSFITEDGTKLDLSSYTTSTTSDGRSIVPTALDLSSGVYFYLWGTDAVTGTNSITVPQSVTFTVDDNDTTKGTVTLNLASSKWNLVLAAASASGLTTIDAVKEKAYYIGYANQDLRYSTSISFYLSSSGLTGNGTANLTLVYDGLTSASGSWTADHVTAVTDTGTSGYTIQASIRSRADNSLASGVSAQTVTNADFFDAGSTLSEWSTAPGTYNLVVSFLNKATSLTYEWSDIIVILPNQDIEATVKIPDVIMYAPDAPSAFKVGYIEPTTNDSNSYNAVFEWSDDSTNEKYFKVEVFQLPSSVAYTAIVDADADWTTYVTGLSTATYQQILGTDFYGDTEKGWVAGSLLKNNEHIVLKLALGARYICRIAAVNDAGSSDWVYATYDNGTSWSDTDTYHTGTYAPSAYTVKEISSTTNVYADQSTVVNAISASLFRVTYYLNGGTYSFDDSTDDTSDLVYYLSQDATDGIPIYNPCNDPAATAPLTYPILVNSSGNRWTSWRDGILEGDLYTTSTAKTVNGFTYYEPSNYKGFENISLFASYTVSAASVQVYVDANYDFQEGEVKITGTGATKVNEYFYDVDSSTADTLVANYAYSNKTSATRTANVAYDTISATIVRASDGVVVASGSFDSSNNFSFASGQLAEGKYQLKVVGEYKGHQYSYNITLNVFDGS